MILWYAIPAPYPITIIGEILTWLGALAIIIWIVLMIISAIPKT